jgi:hypothetical protein
MAPSTGCALARLDGLQYSYGNRDDGFALLFRDGHSSGWSCRSFREARDHRADYVVGSIGVQTAGDGPPSFHARSTCYAAALRFCMGPEGFHQFLPANRGTLYLQKYFCELSGPTTEIILNDVDAPGVGQKRLDG